jgi:stress response protein SCP2
MVVQYVALLTSEKMDHQVFKLVTQVTIVTKQVLTMIVQYAIHLTSENMDHQVFKLAIQVAMVTKQVSKHNYPYLTTEYKYPSYIPSWNSGN